MKSVMLTILVGMFICSTALSEYDWELVKRLDVGKRPAEIFKLDNDNFGGIWIVYCAGWDANGNGIQEDGDEPPSLWYFETAVALISSFNPDWFERITEPQKLLDLEFQNVALPVRFGMMTGDYKLYIPEPSGLSEISFVIDSYHPVVVSVQKRTILPIDVAAVSVGNYLNIINVLYLSIREDGKGSVIIYNRDTQKYLDTIPAYPKVQMTQLTYGGFIILNEKVSDSELGRIQMVTPQYGKVKHIISQDYEVEGLPVYVDFSIVGNDVRTLVTCDSSQQIKSYDGSGNLSSFYLNTDEQEFTGFPRKTYADGYDSYTVSYNGFIYKNFTTKIRAYGRVESIGMAEFQFVAATPYLENNQPDTTVKLISHEPVSVRDKNNDVSYLIYPSPSSDFITITLSNKELKLFAAEDKVQIFDVLGIEVGQSSLIDNTAHNSSQSGMIDLLRIDVSHLTAGVYFIRIGTQVEKFVKM